MNRLHQLSFFDIYEKNARLFKDKTALHWCDQETSFSDLYDQTQSLAVGLSSLETGTRVAVLCKNHPIFSIFLAPHPL